MVNRTFEEVNGLLPAIDHIEGGYSMLEFLCDFYNLEDLRAYFETVHKKWVDGEDDESDEKQAEKNVRDMFKRIKRINLEQWRILKKTFKEINC